MFRQIIQRVLSQQTSEHQQKLIQKLSETDAMMTAARKTHQIVQKVQASVDNIGKPSLPTSPSSSAGDNVPLKHSQLTAADHPRVHNSRMLNVLRRVKNDFKADAAADWRDFKRKFGVK